MTKIIVISEGYDTNVLQVNLIQDAGDAILRIRLPGCGWHNIVRVKPPIGNDGLRYCCYKTEDGSLCYTVPIKL